MEEALRALFSAGKRLLVAAHKGVTADGGLGDARDCGADAASSLASGIFR